MKKIGARFPQILISGKIQAAYKTLLNRLSSLGRSFCDIYKKYYRQKKKKRYEKNKKTASFCREITQMYLMKHKISIKKRIFDDMLKKIYILYSAYNIYK